jgi:tRNA-binding EMAP/Myf-like protein
MTIDEFKQNELRVGTIKVAERVEGSEKLLRLELDLGEPATETGPKHRKQVVIIANLEPRMMMGLESQGMLLAAHGEGGAPVFLSPEKPVEPGSTIT